MLRIPIAPGPHRLIANAPNVLEILPSTWTIHAIHWQSAFKVSHRMIGTRIVGRIVLIGDAAHIHSPAGGRGMNLGIEDAASFAAALDASTLDGWAAKRLARARTVLQGSDQMQRIVTMSGGFWSRLLLRTVALLVNIPFIQRRIVTVVAAADE